MKILTATFFMTRAVVTWQEILGKHLQYFDMKLVKASVPQRMTFLELQIYIANFDCLKIFGIYRYWESGLG